MPARSMDFDWNTVWTGGFPLSWALLHPRGLSRFFLFLPPIAKFLILSPLIPFFRQTWSENYPACLWSLCFLLLCSLSCALLPWPLSGLSLGAHSACWKVTESSGMTRWNRWADSLIFLSKRHTKYRSVSPPPTTKQKVSIAVKIGVRLDGK